jgi:hypothetical protein
VLLQPQSHVELRQVLLHSHSKHAQQSGMQETAHIMLKFGTSSNYKCIKASAVLEPQCAEEGGHQQDDQQQTSVPTVYTAAGHKDQPERGGAARQPWALRAPAASDAFSTSTTAAAATGAGTAAATATGATATAAGASTTATGATATAAGASITTAATSTTCASDILQQQQQHADSRLLRRATRALADSLWTLAGTADSAAEAKRRDRAVSSTLTLAVEYITNSARSADSETAAAAAEAAKLRLECSLLWPLLQAVLRVQLRLVETNSSRTADLADRPLMPGSSQFRALRQTLSAVTMLRPATQFDLQLRGYQHLSDDIELTVPETSSSLRTESGFAIMTKMGLPAPKISSKQFRFTVSKQYATAGDIEAAREALVELLGTVGCASAGGDDGISVFITIADLLQGCSIEIGRGVANALYVVHERLRRRAQSALALLERRERQLQLQQQSSDRDDGEALLLDEQLVETGIDQLTLHQVQREIVQLKHLMAAESSVAKHTQTAMHTSACKFILMKYVHYITAPLSSWMTSSSKARMLGFGAFKAKLKQASTRCLLIHTLHVTLLLCSPCLLECMHARTCSQ